MTHWLEPEERVGDLGTRLLRGKPALPFHAEAAAEFATLAATLRIFYRAAGGPPGITLTASIDEISDHRRSWRARLTGAGERQPQAQLGQRYLLLPEKIGLFADPADNRQLYFWLCAYLTQPPNAPIAELTANAATLPPDIQRDLNKILQSAAICQQVCVRYPGLARYYPGFCAQLLPLRQRNTLPPAELAIEWLIRLVLAAGAEQSHLPQSQLIEHWLANYGDLLQQGKSATRFNHGYRTFMPVPIWGGFRVHPSPDGAARRSSAASAEKGSDDKADPPSEDKMDQKTYRAKRGEFDQSERDDPLILNRFEKLLSWNEMVNLNRDVEEEDDGDKQGAARDLDHLDIASHKHKTSKFLNIKLELDYTPAEQQLRDRGRAVYYPEWQYQHCAYKHNACAVYPRRVEIEKKSIPPAELHQQVNAIRRRFARLQPDLGWQRRQKEGSELDLEPLIEARLDQLTLGHCSDHIYAGFQRHRRDLAITVLLDCSLSTDSWVKGKRVLDIEQRALMLLAHALDASGDPFAIQAFSSHTASFVVMQLVKDHRELFSHQVLQRINALSPGHYTRMGAAIRHAAAEIQPLPQRRKLLLLMTDGKPNDLDHYEGRYGLEDTRHAVIEARAQGMSVFGITIDSDARDYFPYLFGANHYCMLQQPEKLPRVIPRLLMSLLR